jgi:hypothetical protein
MMYVIVYCILYIKLRTKKDSTDFYPRSSLGTVSFYIPYSLQRFFIKREDRSGEDEEEEKKERRKREK